MMAMSYESAEQALAALVDRDRDEDARVEAARALGVLGTIDCIEPMLAVLEAAEARLAAAVSDSLKAMNAAALLARQLRVGSPAAQRERAAMGLVRLADPRVEEALIQATGDDEPRVRAQVYQALARLEGPRVVEALRAGLRDASPDVRCLAAHGLGERGGPNDAAALADALDIETDDLARDYFERARKRLLKRAGGG